MLFYKLSCIYLVSLNNQFHCCLNLSVSNFNGFATTNSCYNALLFVMLNDRNRLFGECSKSFRDCLEIKVNMNVITSSLSSTRPDVCPREINLDFIVSSGQSMNSTWVGFPISASNASA